MKTLTATTLSGLGDVSEDEGDVLEESEGPNNKATGWFTKQPKSGGNRGGTFASQARNRWFELDAKGVIKYFAKCSSDGFGVGMKGMLTVTTKSTITINAGKLLIVNADRTWILNPGPATDLEAWVTELRVIISGGSGVDPDTDDAGAMQPVLELPQQTDGDGQAVNEYVTPPGAQKLAVGHAAVLACAVGMICAVREGKEQGAGATEICAAYSLKRGHPAPL